MKPWPTNLRDIDTEAVHTPSACAVCATHFPRRWEAVCYSCKNTLCYECAFESGGHWYCPGCKPSFWRRILNVLFKPRA